MSRQFLLFLLAGGIAAGVNWGSRFAWNLWMPYWLAIVVAYLCGMVTAFVLSKLFVFTEATHSTGRSVFWFTVVNLIAAAQTWVVAVVLGHWWPHWLAHGIGVAVPVFTSFLGHKHLSFRPSVVEEPHSGVSKPRESNT